MTPSEVLLIQGASGLFSTTEGLILYVIIKLNLPIFLLIIYRQSKSPWKAFIFAASKMIIWLQCSCNILNLI